MRHTRHFSLDQAHATLEWVSERLEEMRRARDRMLDSDAREALGEVASGNGGGPHGRTVSEGFLALREAASQLAAAGVVLRDLDRGLVDFPAILDGREVYLCWVESEENEIAYWHDLDAGYGGRRPL